MQEWADYLDSSIWVRNQRKLLQCGEHKFRLPLLVLTCHPDPNHIQICDTVSLPEAKCQLFLILLRGEEIPDVAVHRISTKIDARIDQSSSVRHGNIDTTRVILPHQLHILETAQQVVAVRVDEVSTYNWAVFIDRA